MYITVGDETKNRSLRLCTFSTLYQKRKTLYFFFAQVLAIIPHIAKATKNTAVRTIP